jgi:hypothetical protein
MAYLILNHPEWLHSEAFCYQLYALIPDYLANSVGSLEKAGVGGSIPSLATTFSIAYNVTFRLCLFHFVPKSNSGSPET